MRGRPRELAGPYLTGVNASPHVQRYGSPAPEQWHGTSMRTRQPQPSWPQLSTVPASWFVICITLIHIGDPCAVPVATSDWAVPRFGIAASTIYPIRVSGKPPVLAVRASSEFRCWPFRAGRTLEQDGWVADGPKGLLHNRKVAK